MPHIHSIRRYKSMLIAAELVFVALFACELLYLHRAGSIQPGRIASFLVLLPPLGAWLCFFPLCYLAWFGQAPTPSLARTLKLAFFWLFVAASSLVWFNILMAQATHIGNP